MLRRKPTRVELTTEDVQEYEAVKKKAEEQKRKKDEIDRRRAKITSERKAAREATEPKEPSRREQVAARIGLRP